MFKVIRPNIELALTPSRIARFRWSLVHTLIMSQQ